MTIFARVGRIEVAAATRKSEFNVGAAPTLSRNHNSMPPMQQLLWLLSTKPKPKPNGPNLPQTPIIAVMNTVQHGKHALIVLTKQPFQLACHP